MRRFIKIFGIFITVLGGRLFMDDRGPGAALLCAGFALILAGEFIKE